MVVPSSPIKFNIQRLTQVLRTVTVVLSAHIYQASSGILYAARYCDHVLSDPFSYHTYIYCGGGVSSSVHGASRRAFRLSHAPVPCACDPGGYALADGGPASSSYRSGNSNGPSKGGNIRPRGDSNSNHSDMMDEREDVAFHNGGHTCMPLSPQKELLQGLL